MKKLSVEPLDIVITGVGGQGNVLASQVLGRAVLNAGYQVTVGETFGLSQRGGSVMSQVRITAERVMGPLIPEHRATAIVSLEPLEALRLLGLYGHPEVMVLTNSRPLLPVNVIAGADKYPETEELKAALSELSGTLHWLDATSVAMELGAAILGNVVMLGALASTGILPVGLPELEAALAEMFPEKKMPANRQALARGRDLLAA